MKEKIDKLKEYYQQLDNLSFDLNRDLYLDQFKMIIRELQDDFNNQEDNLKNIIDVLKNPRVLESADWIVDPDTRKIKPAQHTVMGIAYDIAKDALKQLYK